MSVCVSVSCEENTGTHTWCMWGGGSHSSHNPMTWIYDAHIYLIVLLIESLFKSAGESLVSLSCNLLSSGDAAGRQNENFRAERFVFCGILLQCSFFSFDINYGIFRSVFSNFSCLSKIVRRHFGT